MYFAIFTKIYIFIFYNFIIMSSHNKAPIIKKTHFI